MFVFDTILPVFARTILPVFLVATAGFLLARTLPLDSRTLGRILFYLATPSLVFRSLYQMEIDFAALRQLAAVAMGVAVITGALGWLASFDQERKRRAAITLTSAVSNSGNMGIPISYFALGDVGLALGSIYYVINSFMSNTVGVVVASAGQAPLPQALGRSLPRTGPVRGALGSATESDADRVAIGLVQGRGFAGGCGDSGHVDPAGYSALPCAAAFETKCNFS